MCSDHRDDYLAVVDDDFAVDDDHGDHGDDQSWAKAEEAEEAARLEPRQLV